MNFTHTTMTHVTFPKPRRTRISVRERIRPTFTGASIVRTDFMGLGSFR